MTRPPVPLSQHLLTRSDLARLEIPAGQVLAWLAKGWIEQVGSLPGEGQDGDPVFTVSADELRQQLAPRLATIGKQDVVFTPLRVRSLLMRAMLPAHAPLSSADTEEELQAADPGAADPLVRHLLGTDLALVLQEAATDLETDVDAVLQLAREEARIEADPQQAAIDPATGVVSAGEADDAEAAPEDVEFFDTEALADELAAWEQGDDSAEASESDTGPQGATAEPFSSLEPSLPKWLDEGHDAHAPSIAEAPESDAARDPLDVFDLAPLDTPPASDAEAVVEAEPTNDEPPPEAEQEEHHASVDGDPTEEAAEAAAPAADDAVAVFEEANGAPIADALPKWMDEDAAEVADEAVTVADAPIVAAAADTRDGEGREGVSRGADEKTMAHVQSFLVELRRTLLEIAARQAPPALDVEPLVAAVKEGFQQACSRSMATTSALQSLTERLTDLGQRSGGRLEHTAPSSSPALAAPRSTRPTENQGRAHLVLFAVGLLLLCWAALFWWKTEDPGLALLTLVGANLVACCMLLGHRQAN